MNNKLVVTCVSENTSLHHSLLAQHGQSLHINYFGSEYLFDTGEIYEGFVYNLEHLQISLENIRAIIMSHSHLDHFGALPKLIGRLGNQKLYLPTDLEYLLVNEEKMHYSKNYRVIEGKELSGKAMIQSVKNYQHALYIDKVTELVPGIFTTGLLPIKEEYKEHSLIIKIPGKGLVILVACAHPGIPAIIEKAREIGNDEKIYGIIGGLHYKGLDQEKVIDNIAYLKSLNLSFVIPSHCTGYKAIRVMQDKLGEIVKVSGTGQFGTGNSVQILPDLVLNFSVK
ncbi:MAG: MBL fold metallo-hydrolase [Patescibacteria group bacterium]|nr:MBL fold metallo-hydrolase [Patescibacteria group bacterium]